MEVVELRRFNCVLEPVATALKALAGATHEDRSGLVWLLRT
jgi:hypothetical protein